MLYDSYGRNHDYLRVSITDRCNLRCIYCMPPEGIELKYHEEMLTYEEIIRIISLMSSLGVQNIKITGGEPLLRRGIPSFLKKIKSINGIEKITLTTNGLLLGEYINDIEADGINISLNTLDKERYKKITGNKDTEPQNILNYIDQLIKKQTIVKINCVPIKTVNEEDIIPLTAFAKEKNIIVRFIELMPIGCASNLQAISGKETAAQIENTFGALTKINNISGSGPAVYYSLTGFMGKIGFINAVTHNFCETCNRLRLTSDGLLKLCLSSDLTLDLRKPLREGASDKYLTKIIQEFVQKKPKLNSFPAHHPACMSKIGG